VLKVLGVIQLAFVDKRGMKLPGLFDRGHCRQAMILWTSFQIQNHRDASTRNSHCHLNLEKALSPSLLLHARALQNVMLDSSPLQAILEK
jgi:hypothetical protein